MPPRPLTALPYSFRHALQRIKRKTHGRTRESSCCVRPFRRVKKRGANASLCTSLPDLIKGPFATDGCLFVGDFVKDFSVVDGLGERTLSRRRRRRLLVFLSLRESTPADLLPIVPLLIDRNFISITSYFDRSQARFFGRLQIPLAFPCKRTKIDIFRASLFLLRSRTYNFQKTGAKDTFIILDFNEMRISPS